MRNDTWKKHIECYLEDTERYGKCNAENNTDKDYE